MKNISVRRIKAAYFREAMVQTRRDRMLYEEHASLHMVLYFNQRRINELEAKIEGLQWNVIQPVKVLLVPAQFLV